MDLLATELRMGEYIHSQDFYDRVSRPTTLMEYEMWASGHGAISVSHGRNFRRTGWLLKDLRPYGELLCIRVFDVGRIDGFQAVTVCRYSGGVSEAPSTRAATWSWAKAI